MNQDTLAAFERLSTILDTLRKECPWDRVQTMESLRYLTIEETYELSEAIAALKDKPSDSAQENAEMKKELGDLFMHLMFYAKIAEEEKRFDLRDVLDAISEKLIARHPFIYHKDEYAGESWEQIKMREGRKSVMEGVPASLPPLVKAVRMQEKAAGIGYRETMAQEASPLLETNNDGDLRMNAKGKDTLTEDTFGDLLLSLVHWAHDRGINADDALTRANARYKQRVQQFENA